MRGLGRDIRYALRVYAATPVASAFSVIVLAVAMAFVGSFLSLYIDLVVKPTPGFQDSRELVTVGQNEGNRVSIVNWEFIERANQEVVSLSSLAGFMTTNLDVGPEREALPFELVSHDFFTSLRPQMRLGRGLESADHELDAEPVAVLTHRYWQQVFGGSPDAIGQTIDITGGQAFNPQPAEDDPGGPPAEPTTPFRIVGVVSETLPSLQGRDSIAFVPFEVAAPRYFDDWDRVRFFRIIGALGRLAPGVAPDAVAAELEARFASTDDLNVNAGTPFDAMRGLVLNIRVQQEAARQLRLFLAGSVLVALVAAANVSLFLLSRAPGRRRELGIRMSVGATLKRLARQLASEAGLLIVVGAFLGMLLSLWLQVYLQELPFLENAGWRDVSLFDWRVLGATAVFLTVLTVTVALAPALSLMRAGIASSTRQVASRANLTQRIACTAQIAIAGTVAAAAIAFGWYLGSLRFADHGYDIRDVHVIRLAQSAIDFSQGPSLDWDALFVARERRREQLTALPGIDAVSFATAGPGIEIESLPVRILRPDAPDEAVLVNLVSADRDYFEMLDIEVIDGRLYESDERDVFVVNEAAAEQIYGRTDVSGETLPRSLSGADSSELIGVVRNVSHGHPDAEVEPRSYSPIIPFFSSEGVFVRSQLSTAEIRDSVQGLVDAGDLDGEVLSVNRPATLVAETIAADRARGLLTVVSAAIVVLLAGFGFYGTQRYLVSAGRREYAIRASLGAGPDSLGRLVAARSIMLSLPGFVLGGLLAFIVVAWLRDDFVSRDVLPWLVTAAVLGGLALLLVAASAGPARLARTTQPAPLLREE